MEIRSDIRDKIFIDKYKVIYIYLINILLSILLYKIFNYDSIKIVLLFRLYYIVLCLSLFICLKQISKFNNQYVSKIIGILFSLIIGMSMLGFLENVRTSDIYFGYLYYMDLSINITILLEVFICYIITKYHFEDKESTKLSYLLILVIVLSMILTYHCTILFNVIKISFFIIEIPLLLKIYIKIKKIVNSKKDEVNFIKYWIISIIFIIGIYFYGFYNDKQYLSGYITEIIHLSNFMIICSVILINFVFEPYKLLANSLKSETKELDILNKEISNKNKEFEKSISVLKNNEYLYSTFFRYMPHPIVIINKNNERIIFINEQFSKLLDKYNLKDIINKKIDRYIDFLKNDAVNKNYNAILNVNGKKKFIDTKILQDNLVDGTQIILIKDNTSIVLKEEMEKEVKSKKIEENMRTQFLSSISHDLKTPINIIYYANQIEELYIQKEDFTSLIKYNAICRNNCIYLIKLTNNLIDNSQINFNYLIPRLRKYNLVEIVEDNVMSLVEYVKWNDIDLIFDTNTEECYLDIDKEFMYRIVLNLVLNAVKYTNKNGKIYVVINEDSDYVRISIKYDMIGIEKKFIDKVFNKYDTEDNDSKISRNKSSMELFVVKELVELQGGNIQIVSNDNIETDISIQFKKEN